ncbi:hypothetical protein L0P88_04010 [Muricauda sp. SCSIO 64092]|uniref:hypothetical protein n=1 Tax=Allomuricauda sp. SCSIO 64092 TaxID=2908842 RepID=UPI001FF1E541|nr:hypothetical protein [Muricauda sp. SCSIO 64092]UOY07719.1 hypothetical protein L0P88_04010 [Muricauda sp. SCSIO 64092]
MSKESSKIDPKKKQQIISAILEMNQMADVEFMLGDVTNLYFMALEHYQMNDPDTREGKTLTFLHLHDCLAKIDMILNDRESCWLLAV